MCCMRLVGNAGPKKSPKIGHLDTIAQLCRAVSSQLRHVSTIGKKIVKQQYLLHMCPQYGKLWPNNGWDWFTSLGQPSKLQRVSRLAFVLRHFSDVAHQRPTKLCTMFGCLLRWHTIYTFSGALARTEFCLYIQVLRSTILYGTAAAGISQTVQRGTRNGFMELSQRAPPILGWAAITLGISLHSTFIWIRQRGPQTTNKKHTERQTV